MDAYNLGNSKLKLHTRLSNTHNPSLTNVNPSINKGEQEIEPNEKGGEHVGLR